MKNLFINNWQYFAGIVGKDLALKVRDDLSKEIYQKEPQESIGIFFSLEALCEFQLVSITDKYITYTFIGTAS